MATLRKPIDMSKFLKSVSKSIPNISSGFNDPVIWVDTGSFLLNKLISNDFFKGVPLEGKFIMFAGESGSGKSLIVAGNMVRYCQANDIFPIIIDTENAIDKQWLLNLGVDPEDGQDESGQPNGKAAKLLKFNISSVEDLAKFLGDFITDYKDRYSDIKKDERPKFAIIIDSLGMLVTEQMISQADEGTIQGDMGIKAKKLTHTIRTTLSKINGENIGLWATNHVYASQDKYTPDKISGGMMLEFAASMIVQINKLLLKEDEDGNKLVGGEVAGIRANINVRKSRYAKPFEKMQIMIPFDTGMNPYSGLIDFFEKRGILTKEGNRFVYIDKSGKKHIDYRKNITNDLLDQIMFEWDETRFGFKGADIPASEDEKDDDITE